MKKLDLEIYSDEEISKLLMRDPIARNKYLGTLMEFINNIDGHLTLNLIGEWGTGKTIFLKQLEYLSKNSIEPEKKLTNLNSDIIREYQEKYDVFYFNAWENDLYGEPLEALIYQLIMKLSEMQEAGSKINDKKKSLSDILKKSGILITNYTIKKITSGYISLEDIKSEDKESEFKIKSINEKKESISSLLNTLTEITSKKVLIIIDELDRCKPSYAVELLETVKHFFNNPNIVFLFASNKLELSVIIQSNYGQNFNGYKYLNRFFDYEFNLPEISPYNYFKLNYSQSLAEGHIVTKIMQSISEYHNFTMRDMNRLYSLNSSLENFWKKSISWNYDNALTKYYLLPYAIGLKIHDGNMFKSFVEGQGLSELISFYNYSEKIANRTMSNKLNNDSDGVEELSKFYKKFSALKNEEELRYSNDQEIYDIKRMLEVLTMMSDFS